MIISLFGNIFNKTFTVLQNLSEINKLKIKLVRYSDDGKTTLGKLFVKNKSYYTCEPSWKDNERNISCIPNGCYEIEKFNSPTHRLCLSVSNVPNRSYILIHAGNTHYDTKGCILVGLGLINKIYNKENRKYAKGITYSRKALNELLDIVGDKKAKLIISNSFL